jgi:DNA-binding GntR family transcriptional regulator
MPAIDRLSARSDPRHKTAHDQAYDFLRSAILSGRLRGGARLHQAAIAQRLKMSRIPVRDAIGRLHSEGLVTVQPNRTVVVTELGPDEIMEIFEIRAALEGLAVRLALPRLHGEILVELEHLLQRMDRAVDDVEGWIDRHDAFHDYLHQWSDRPRLLAQIRQLRAAGQPYFRLYVEWKKNPEFHGYEHRAILEAVAEGDARKADLIMQGHVMRAATKITEFLRDVKATSPAPQTVDPLSAH